MALNEKQKRFADEYLIDLNASKAAVRSGYSEKTAGSQGFDLLKKPEIQAYLEERRQLLAEKTQVDQEWVIRRFKEISDRCMTAVPVMEFDYANKELVQKTDENGEGVYEFDSAGANKATEMIGKHLGMFITKKIEGDFTVTNISGMEVK